MLNTVEALKMEFANKYGLDVNQVRIDVTIEDVPSHDLAQQIVKDAAIQGQLHTFGDCEHIESDKHSYWVSNYSRNFDVTAKAKNVGYTPKGWTIAND